MTLTELLPVLALIEPPLVVVTQGHHGQPARFVAALLLSICLGIIGMFGLFAVVKRDVRRGNFGNGTTIMLGLLWVAASMVLAGIVATSLTHHSAT